MRLAPVDFLPNAVNKTGRLVATVIPINSQVWPAAIIDLNTGHVEIIRTGSDADMDGGWTRDGRLLLNALTSRSSIWRFRPER
jgi:hypothetical protein